MEGKTLDWVYLPAGQEVESLWVTLHDSYLCRVSSDRLARTVVLEFAVKHIAAFHGFGDDHRFFLRFGGVTAVRAVRWLSWPGGYVKPADASREEEEQCLREYWRKARTESVAWDALEQVLADPEMTVLIHLADLAQADGAVAFRAQGYLDDEVWHECFVAAESLVISDSTGRTFSLDEFLDLGGAYWDAFGERKSG